MTIQPFFKSVNRVALTSALLASIAFPALAETVIHRGNGGEPQSLDQSQISIDIEGFIVRDLSEGLTVYDAKGQWRPPGSDRITVPAITCSPIRSARGRSSHAALPIQSAKVLRSRSRPSRA